MKRGRIVPQMDARSVLQALRNSFGRADKGWVFFEELRLGTGWSDQYPAEKRIDAWAMNTWPSNNLKSVAFEVKVSRSDFFHEIQQPEKRLPAMTVSNEFYFACPENLIGMAECPEDVGLLWIKSDGQVRTMIRSPYRTNRELTWRFMASLARRIDKAANSITRLGGE